MNSILRNILAVVAGIVVGSVVNMGIVMLSPHIIPPPEGIVTSDMESLKSNMHLFETKHYIMPFLAHALGTICGAFLAAIISANRHLIFAMVIGAVFLIGGIMAVVQLPAPLWFEVLDLTLAYIPMAYLGYMLSGKRMSAATIQ